VFIQEEYGAAVRKLAAILGLRKCRYLR